MKFIPFILYFLQLALASSDTDTSSIKGVMNCKESIKGWQSRYRDIRRYHLPVDHLIQVAMNLNTLLPPYSYELHKILGKCKKAIYYQETVIESKNTSKIELPESSRKINEILKDLSNRTNTSELAVLKLMQMQNELNNHEYSRNLNRFINIAEFISIISKLQLQQKEFTIVICKIIKEGIKKIAIASQGLQLAILHAEKELGIDLILSDITLAEMRTFIRKMLIFLKEGYPRLQILKQTTNDKNFEINVKNAIIFLNDAFRYIEPIIDLYQRKLNFSVYAYQNYSSSELRMRELCDHGINDDIQETNMFCTWLSVIIHEYLALCAKTITKMNGDSINIYKKHIYGI